MTADEQGYQGWKNYETWATALWIDNEEPSYLQAREYAERVTMIAESDPNVTSGIWTVDETRRFRLADILKDWVSDMLLPDLGATLSADLLNAAVSGIEWTEIADHYLDR